MKHGGKVWVLERDAFQAAVLIENRLLVNDDVERLRRIKIFRTLPNHTLAKIAELMQIVSLEIYIRHLFFDCFIKMHFLN